MSRPPVVLIHGAANSSGVWRFWQEHLAGRGWPSYALDLRGHGESEALDLADVGMADYVADVLSVVRDLREPPVLLGWSMGGLVGMMAAEPARALACVGLAPSVPARRTDPSVPIRRGTFGPEEYGIVDRHQLDQPTMPDLDDEERRLALAALGGESRRARDERTAGVVMTGLPCPCLIVTGGADAQWPPARYASLPLAADHRTIDGASHWGLVLSRRALAVAGPAVLSWLESRLSGRESPG